MQSVLTTTNYVSSNPAQSRCTQYYIMSWSLSVTCDRSFFVFFWWIRSCKSKDKKTNNCRQNTTQKT